jgi:acetyl coenzyme A synthetase (ADP forming)-like protein
VTSAGPYDTDVVLRDGSTLRLRAPRPEDLEAIADLEKRFGPPDPAERGPGWPPVAERLDEPEDPRQRLTLIGEAGGRLVAVARYTRQDAPADSAFVGIAVIEPLQGRGVGTRILDRLAAIAWEHGVRRFTASAPLGAERRLRMFLDSGYAVEERRDGDACLLSLSLRRGSAWLRRDAARSETAAAASMRPFFAPRGVAVVGASTHKDKIGSAILANLRTHGYRGPLFAVHPTATAIDGVPAVPRVTAIPDPIDLAVIAVPARAAPEVVDDCIAKGVRAVVMITAGFAETGPAGARLEADLLERVRRAGIRMVGPNCMGLLSTDPSVPVNATFAPVTPPAGVLAMSTQSGALGLVILDYARSLDLGLSSFVSVGNAADVSSNDLIQYWSSDPRTRVILLYVESFGNPRNFSAIARRVGRSKPIVAVKSGRSAAGARAASSHTGALATRDVIVDALFRQAGVIRTDTIEELFDAGMLLAHQPVPRGRGVAILTNAGGPGILAADACEAHGLKLPALSETTLRTLRSFLPAEASVANPVDMIASATADHYERALTALLADEAVDSVLVIFIPPLVTRTEDVARGVQKGVRDAASAAEGAAGAAAAKPVLGVFMSATGANALLAPIPCFRFPEAAILALARVTAHGEWLRRPESAPPSFPDAVRDAARHQVAQALGRGGGWLLPAEVEALLTTLGVPVARSEQVSSEEDAARAATRIGYPVVLKAIGPTLLHKTEAGAVVLRLADEAAVRAAWRDLAERLGEVMSGALVQEMVTGGVEMLAGGMEDPTFGPVVACALGGTLTEILSDAQFRLCPLGEAEAREMITSLRGAAILQGARGAKPADTAALEAALLRLSALLTWCPEIREIEINPLLVLPRGARAVDARVRVEPGARLPARRLRY